MSLIKAWSYSRYDCYTLCPLQFKLRHIDKLPWPGSAAMARGNEVHKGVASYVTGGDVCPPEALKHSFPAKLVEELRAFEPANKLVEQQWGFTASWKPTGWFGKDTWFRSILDAAVLYDDLFADVVDWKTGKKYGSNAEQMELNALALLCHFKPALGVTTRMVYLDIGEEDTADFVRADQEKLQAKWEQKVVPMFSDTVFAPRPNDKCRFCAFSRSNNGPCRYG